MPPRFAYWTILVDNQPTSFRSSSADDLLPTFNRLKAKNPTAVMMWFQGGKLWPSRLDAQEAMRARGDIGRSRDPRQRSSDPKNLDWKPKSPSPRSQAPSPRDSEKLDWKPKSPNAREVARRDWKPKPYTPKTDPKESSEKLEWKPASAKASAGQAKERFKQQFKSKTDARPEWRAKTFNPKGKSFKPSRPRPQAPGQRNSEKLEWKPKAGLSRRSGDLSAEGRRPKVEAAKAESREPKAESRPEFRDRKKWRPGGDHKDPRQKYKDAKKAKWTRFKQAIRARSTKKRER